MEYDAILADERAVEDVDWFEGTKSVKSTKMIQTVEDRLREEIYELRLKLEELQAMKLEEVRDQIYVEELEELEAMESYCRSEIYADIRNDIEQEVRAKEYLPAKERIQAQARADIEAEVKAEIMKKISEANDKI